MAEAPYPESLLTSHFVKSVKDRHLARTTWAKINESTTAAMSFQQVREAAILWDDEEDEVGASVNAISHKTLYLPYQQHFRADPEVKAMMLAIIKRMDKLLEKSTPISTPPTITPASFFPTHPIQSPVRSTQRKDPALF